MLQEWSGINTILVPTDHSIPEPPRGIKAGSLLARTQSEVWTSGNLTHPGCMLYCRPQLGIDIAGALFCDSSPDTRLKAVCISTNAFNLQLRHAVYSHPKISSCAIYAEVLGQ